MQALKKSGFYLLSPFMIIFALLFILLTPDRPEFDSKGQAPKKRARHTPGFSADVWREFSESPAYTDWLKNRDK